MKKCDIFIGVGYVYKRSFQSAKKKHGAVTINDWGSKHNELQWEILSKIKSIKQQPKYIKKRVLDGYNYADYIAVPSSHSKESFQIYGVPEEKLIQNPYGVEVSQFYPTCLSNETQYDVIMVGGWSYVKGCDLIIDYFKNSKLTFLHVGPIVNMSFPRNIENMTHVDSVDQKKLVEYYSLAKIFILPSRAEGLAMVQIQAIVCGLPLVCSKHTGGRDLKKFIPDPKWIVEIENLSLEELSKGINLGLELAKTQKGIRKYCGDLESNLTWTAYAKRYEKKLIEILNFKS